MPRKTDGTTWALLDKLPSGEPGPDAFLSKAIAELHECATEGKKLENRAQLAKGTLEQYCESLWIKFTAAEGHLPTPVKLVSSEGKSVVWIVQDRTKSASVSDEAYGQLADAIGEDAAASAVSEKTTFALDPDVLMQQAPDGRTVLEVAAEYLQLMAADMIVAKALTVKQANGLVKQRKVRSLEPGFFDGLPARCGGDAGRFTAAVKALGSSIVRCVRV